jgi:hypothetical protein
MFLQVQLRSRHRFISIYEFCYFSSFEKMLIFDWTGADECVRPYVGLVSSAAAVTTTTAVESATSAAATEAGLAS